MRKKVLLLIFILILGFASLFKVYDYEKNKKRSYEVVVDLKKGKSLNRVFKELGLEDSIFFKLFLKLEKESGKNIKAGYYELNGEYSYKEIIEIMEEGREKYLVLTIPEGYSIKEIGRLLEKNGYGSTQGIENALKEIKDFPYPTPNGNFEGYLYPETYYFSGVVTEKELVERMLEEFLKKFPPEKYTNKNEFYKQLIMASIIDREAQIGSEKPIMASVFYNRLKKGMKLASDATVNFAYDYTKRRMYYKDLEIDSPYNTYKYKGLPPAPISNPDEESVYAAMNPANTDYLFFVATGGGKHTFTRTYKEHLEVQRKK
nr:endolytic transglycosylase MltG [uncultured Cetobacterium sp.]